VGLTAALWLGAAVAQEYQPPHDRPGPAADRLLFRSFHVDRAGLDLRAGNMDLYFFGLRTDSAIELRGAEGVQLFEAPATTLSLVLNPAPAPSGRLNPFSIPQIRQAMQLLVNRDFITQDLFRGMALPMITHVSPMDYDFLTVYQVDRGSGIRYDPEYARQLIAEAMTAAGAELVDGVWNFGGQPIRLRFIARVEDERREVGDLVRAELEAAGFMVTMSYQNFAPAVLAVYSTDPAAFEWHLYTEGWGRSAPTRYDVGTINSMNAPWLGNMPGWREVGYWQYEHAELDEIGQRLFRGEFGSRAERDELYARMTGIGLQESVRIWIATVINSFPASSELQGVTLDIVAGPKSPWTLREAYVPGSGDVTVGNLWVWTERTTWNPIAGFGDVYGVDIWRNLSDPPLWNDPFSGLPEPFRASFEVETAGPAGWLDVPADAQLWNVEQKAWVNVPAGTQARSKVTFDYADMVGANWHHGQQITLADALYSIMQGFDIAYDPNKSRIEVAMAFTARPYLETLRGYRAVGDDRLEVYVDFWHFEQAQIASYASPAPFAMPWELLAAMDDVVFSQRRGAYSDTAAARYNVPWLSLVMNRDARLLDRTLRQFISQRTVPAGVFEFGGRNLVSADEAVARYEAAMDWFRQHDHLVIANGPFWLARYDPPAQFAELHAFRDPTYPYKPGDRYRGRAQPVSVTYAGTPSLRRGQDAELEVQVAGPGTLSLSYLLFDPAVGALLASGQADAGTGGAFTVRLPASLSTDLFPGLYHLYLVGSSDELATISERRVDLEVTP